MNGLFVLFAAFSRLATGATPPMSGSSSSSSPDSVHPLVRSIPASGHALAHRRGSGRRTHHHGSARHHSRSH